MAWHDALSKKYQTRRPNRLNNKAKRVEYAGRWFDSGFERELYQQLLLEEKAKLINNIRCQVVIEITAHVKWRADFVVFNLETNEDEAREAKGHENERWLVIKNLLKDLAPMNVKIYKKQGKRISIVEEIKKHE